MVCYLKNDSVLSTITLRNVHKIQNHRKDRQLLQKNKKIQTTNIQKIMRVFFDL